LINPMREHFRPAGFEKSDDKKSGKGEKDDV
jgi:hypothetical protein